MAVDVGLQCAGDARAVSRSLAAKLDAEFMAVDAHVDADSVLSAPIHENGHAANGFAANGQCCQRTCC